MLSSTEGNCVIAFTAGIPRLRINRVHQRRARETAVLLKKVGGGSNLVGKARSPKNLGYQGVRVQRDGRDQSLQFFRSQRRALSRIPRLLSSCFKRRTGND